MKPKTIRISDERGLCREAKFAGKYPGNYTKKELDYFQEFFPVWFEKGEQARERAEKKAGVK